jgi:hypothetical protein
VTRVRDVHTRRSEGGEKYIGREGKRERKRCLAHVVAPGRRAHQLRAQGLGLRA